MSMRLYNTLTRKVEEFAPLDGKTVRMYVCGPTVYDDPHIGHARSAYIFDVLRRYLEYKAFSVQFVRNVTDVDDKIIEKARQELAVSSQQSAVSDLSTKCAEVAQRYLKSYHETMDRLGIGRPTREPLATGHIDEMLNLISQLVLNGSAYETKTGDVYFAVRKFPGYGKLSNRTVDELQVGLPAPRASRQAGTRVEPGEHPAHPEALGGAGKQDPLDFALWKAAKPDEPAWNSPWGKGRPGWHIECSAMSTKYLGDEFDIHGGGVDLVFPHHENEIAQAQAAGKPFARFWIHNGLLTVNGEKMSKSLGNYVTVEQALTACQSAWGAWDKELVARVASVASDILKVFFLGAHYRSPIDYTTASLKAASKRYYNFFQAILTAKLSKEHSADTTKSINILPEARDSFVKAMDDDLNTPQALAVLDQLGREIMQAFLKLRIENPAPAEQIRLRAFSISAHDTLIHLGEQLGLTLGLFRRTELSDEESVLFNQYKAARARKDFQTSDEKRKQLQEKGFVVQDTPTDSIIFRSRV